MEHKKNHLYFALLICFTSFQSYAVTTKRTTSGKEHGVSKELALICFDPPMVHPKKMGGLEPLKKIKNLANLK